MTNVRHPELIYRKGGFDDMRGRQRYIEREDKEKNGRGLAVGQGGGRRVGDRAREQKGEEVT